MSWARGFADLFGLAELVGLETMSVASRRSGRGRVPRFIGATLGIEDAWGIQRGVRTSIGASITRPRAE
jgi:hypothetical protein